jgi:hypothetical protein
MKCVHHEKAHYPKSGSEDWTARGAKTAEEAMEQLKVGFDYVTDFDGVI